MANKNVTLTSLAERSFSIALCDAINRTAERGEGGRKWPFYQLEMSLSLSTPKTHISFIFASVFVLQASCHVPQHDRFCLDLHTWSASTLLEDSLVYFMPHQQMKQSEMCYWRHTHFILLQFALRKETGLAFLSKPRTALSVNFKIIPTWPEVAGQSADDLEGRRHDGKHYSFSCSLFASSLSNLDTEPQKQLQKPDCPFKEEELFPVSQLYIRGGEICGS